MIFSLFIFYSERGEPGIGGQKGDQGKVLRKIFSKLILLISFILPDIGPPGPPGIDGEFPSKSVSPIEFIVLLVSHLGLPGIQINIF